MVAGSEREEAGASRDGDAAQRAWVQAYAVAALALLVLAVLVSCARGADPWLCALGFLAVGAVLSFGWRARQAMRRERAQAAAADARAKSSVTMLEHVFESVLDPILAIDERGMVLAANPATERVFGWESRELIGKNVNVLMGEPYRTEHDGYMRSYLQTGERRAIGRIRKVIGRRRDGEEFACELSVSEVWTADGRRFFGVVRDVSERERFAMRMANAERLAAVGEVAAGIAHEVNNPVNTIINCAQMVKDGDNAPELCDHIIHEGFRIAGFVRELMNMAAARDEDARRIDVHEPLRRALSLLAVRLRHGGLVVETDFAGDLPPVLARPHRLEQVFLNLLLNAYDALRESPRPDKRVRVTTRTATDDGKRLVSVSVHDNGPGVPEYARERIFQPFYTTKKSGEGTGLGLAVSSTIVRDHGGRIVLRSEVGAFAEFVVLLPAA